MFRPHLRGIVMFDMMILDDFTLALAAELRLRGVPYLFPELVAFAADRWR